ncbi:MAG: DEAD/DEAH box helicase [Candidatus Omnitrophota bacterium]
MGQVDALRMVEHVRTRLVDLAVSENYVRDSKLSEATRKIWEGQGVDGGLVSELWVEGAFSGKCSSDSLKSLSADGLFPDDLCHHVRGVFPENRPLYIHQSEALRKAAANIKERPSLIITAGTGLGKTEAFLLPMLADLWTAPKRRSDGGMRCLILYPMNALVADQVDRIYRWLQGQNRITVFHFTSATPEDVRRANQLGESIWEACRMRTRDEARGRESHNGKRIDIEPFGNVPDIVITNYSMLEYMLCRPQDSRFFGPDLRCIILDEAHLYSGTLATEIMMLLRRFHERCGVSPSEVLHMATSATLGGNDEELQSFAASLFSTDKTSTFVIHGGYADHDLGDKESPPLQSATAAEIAKFDDFDFETMTTEDDLIEDNQEVVDRLCKVVSYLVSDYTIDRARQKYPKSPARFLHESLRESTLIRKAAEILAKEKGSILSLNDLASRLFNGNGSRDERNATITLLRLSAAARLRASDLPLVPHRLHFLVRAPEGLSVCLNPQCSGPGEYRIMSIGCLQPLGDRCQYCKHILLPIHRCDNCGEWALAAHENQETSCLEPGYSNISRTFYLLTKPPKLKEKEDVVNVEVDSLSGEKKGVGSGVISLWTAPFQTARGRGKERSQRCPTCESMWTPSREEEGQPEWRQICQRLIGGRPFALSVAAEIILHDLPPYRGNTRHWKPAEGRRLLSFSDSRASAARLGPLLTQQHEMQVVRAAMARSVQELTSADTTDYLIGEVDRLEKQLRDIRLSPELKLHLGAELRDKQVKLQRSKVGTSFAEYAMLVAQRPEISQILDRDTAERHDAEKYGQSDWKKNREEVRAHIEGLIANELEPPIKKRASVESVGLIEIVYPGIENLSIPPRLEEKLPSNVRQKISETWPNFVVLLLDTVRGDGCVAWSKDTAGRMWLGESPLLGRWLTRSRRGWGATAFVGATQQQFRRTFVSQVLKEAGCDGDQLEVLSAEVLYAVFDQLFQLAGGAVQGIAWLKKEDHHQTGHEEDDKAIQILLDRLSVRAPTQLYRCEATGTIWTHSSLGWAPGEGCVGTLRLISPEILDKDTRWGRSRREFINSPIFSVGLWAEEHSAQLSPGENKRLQDLFKNGIRNVLSSTTTMELGIDIGGLNGVLLSNVPPGPANHRQRAGRAGRRSDGSAVVVTYSRDSEYDREVFRRFGEFLKRDLRKPTVSLNRERIIRRHLYAVLLSEFLRSKQPGRTGAMHAFGRMGTFCGVSAFPLPWIRVSEPKPSWPQEGVNVAYQFLEFLEQLKMVDGGFQNRLFCLSEHTSLSAIGKLDGWREFISSAMEAFRKAIEEWNNDIKQLKEAWSEIPLEPKTSVGREMAKANSILYMIKPLCEITVIEWLADRRFLPRYGFPINLQRLSVRKAVEGRRHDYSEPDERYRLERSSLLALSEYVPGSSVLVGGRVATSSGLRKHWTDGNLDEALGLQYFSLKCQEGHVYIHQSLKEACPRCGGNPLTTQQLVFPRFGYTTAGWDKLPLGTNLERIGEQSVCPTAFVERSEGEVSENFAGVSKARIIYREEAPLLVRNSGRHGYGFAICTLCGFATSESKSGQGQIDLPKSFEKHASVFSSNPNSFCWEKDVQTPPVLRNRVLAARELTDMVLLEWPGATLSVYNGVYSFGRALILAGARLLELDQRELGIELMPLSGVNIGIVIYDTTPGGAGHCQELINLGKEWINATRAILYVDAKHHSRCQKACLDCILDFSGQYSANHLDRRTALTLLDNALMVQ